MMHLDHLIDELLRSQAVVTAFVSLVLGIVGYITHKLNTMSKKIDLDQQAQTTIIESSKRSALRNEYLAIYNSPMFTLEQKYGMTREIIRDYERLNGNHYLHALDKAMAEKLEGNDINGVANGLKIMADFYNDPIKKESEK